jgi:hypothetical protein
MPQSVKLDAADAGRLDQPGELPIADRVDLERQAERIGSVVQVAPFLREREAEVRIVLPVAQLNLGLMFPMSSQQRDRLGREINRAAGLGFCFAEDWRSSGLEQRPTDRQLACIQVYVRPAQRRQPAAPRARIERQRIEGGRLRTGGLRRVQEGCGFINRPQGREDAAPENTTRLETATNDHGVGAIRVNLRGGPI